MGSMTTLEPTAVWRTWFPALVRLPDGRVIQKCKVFATNGGLHVYASSASGGPPVSVYASAILLDKTSVPGTDYASEKRGHVIVTEAGNVTVLRTGGSSCGCTRELRALTPDWARAEKTWGE